MTTAAAAAAAQYCCSTTKRMPRHYYCVREVQALISLASPPFGLRAFYAHARTMVDCTVLAVFLTGLNFPPKGNLVYIYIRLIIAFVVRQCAAWASTLISHKHPPEEEIMHHVGCSMSVFLFVSIVRYFNMVLPKPIRVDCGGSSSSSPVFWAFFCIFVIRF